MVHFLVLSEHDSNKVSPKRADDDNRQPIEW